MVPDAPTVHAKPREVNKDNNNTDIVDEKQDNYVQCITKVGAIGLTSEDESDKASPPPSTLEEHLSSSPQEVPIPISTNTATMTSTTTSMATMTSTTTSMVTTTNNSIPVATLVTTAQ